MTHRIRRQILDLELPREAGALELQRQAGRVFQEKVLPRLNEVFGKIAPTDHIVRIERLEIDLGSFGETNWERSFVERCIEQISRQVTEAAFEASPASDANTQTLGPEENTLAVFQYFLGTGTLPWHARGLTLKALEIAVAKMDPARVAVWQDTLLPILRKKTAALQRLIWQFSPAFSHKIIEIALGATPGWVDQAAQIIRHQTAQTLDGSRYLAFLQALFSVAPAAVFQQPPQTSLPAQLFYNAPGAAAPPSDISTKKPAPPETETRPESRPETALEPKPSAEKRRETDLPAEGVWVDHAGVVLLAVYLPVFFAELELTAGDSFATLENQYRAVHLLHFLATGQENPEEPALALLKILCGLGLEEPIPLHLELSDKEKVESTDLLKAVVQNWPALKNTSPEGLRSGFLQRMGHLSRPEGQFGWLLRPERQAQDLLLERLPWSISVLKLPWMEEAIRVEW